MYCSLRFFVDKTPDLTKAQNILDIFELFEHTLRVSYDYILYTVFDPDKDDPLIDKKYFYNTYWKEIFLTDDILKMFIGKSGDFSAPIITATCAGKSTQIYSKIRVQIQFPVYTQPFVICVDYEQQYTDEFTFRKYNFLIQSLTAMGFHINNCFYHIYPKKNEAATLDRGQVGHFLNCYEQRNLKKSVLHHSNGCLNRFMDIYYFNSVRLSMLTPEIISKIADIVGTNNLIITDDILSFALGNAGKESLNYRITHHYELRKLEKLLL